MSIACNVTSAISRAVLLAVAKGYRVDSQGRVWGPRGVRSTAAKKSPRGPYLFETFTMKDREGKVQTVPVARLAAYQRFGCPALGAGVIVRHRDDNGLNNRPTNLALGDSHDNSMDRPKAQRVAQAKRAAKASAKKRRAKR